MTLSNRLAGLICGDVNCVIACSFPELMGSGKRQDAPPVARPFAITIELRIFQ
jgi:hypothetical protein